MERYLSTVRATRDHPDTVTLTLINAKLTSTHVKVASPLRIVLVITLKENMMMAYSRSDDVKDITIMFGRVRSCL